MRLLSMLIAIAMLGSGFMAEAQQKKRKKTKSLHDQFTGQGYGMAGCGLGSIVFGEAPGMIQIFAATTNGYGGQTFAISSGTSNCGESGKAEETASYIQNNKVALENDLARGQGETLVGLAQMIECEKSTFATDMKSEYTNMFPQGGASAAQIQVVAYKACNI